MPMEDRDQLHGRQPQILDHLTLKSWLMQLLVSTEETFVLAKTESLPGWG